MPYQKMIFLIHSHFDLKISHFDSKNHLPDVCEMFNEIKQDEQSGVCKKWEDAYKCMCKVTKQEKAKAVDDDDKIEAPFEMDANMLYMEV